MPQDRESSKDCNLYKGTERKLCPAKTPGLQPVCEQKVSRLPVQLLLHIADKMPNPGHQD